MRNPSRPLRVKIVTTRNDDHELVRRSLKDQVLSTYEIVGEESNGNADIVIADAEGPIPGTPLPLILLCDEGDDRFRHTAIDVLRRDIVSGPLLERVVIYADRVQSLENRLLSQGSADPLTGLADRTRFFELGKQEFVRANRYGAPLSFIMVDGDHCHRINDIYGPEGGDMMLKALAEICLAAVREVDLVARYGGEEFAVLLPETDMIGASNVARRIHHEVSKREVSCREGKFSFTASLGVATAAPEIADFSALVSAANGAMETAKRKGRNRIEPDVIFT